MTKAACRELYSRKRESISEQEYAALVHKLSVSFRSFTWPRVHMVHAYKPVRSRREPDPEPLIQYLSSLNQGLQVAAPLMNPATGTLRHRLVQAETEWKVNRSGIAEPLDGKEVMPGDIDLVFLPLLAFDARGYRVGYGQGYYDRFLAECRPDVLKIGLSFFEQVDEISDVASFDIAMNFCITPNRVYEF